MESQKYIKTLDGWRAIAIIAVILSHLKETVSAPESPLFQIFAAGMHGVDLFFAISGYIISTKLFSELDAHRTLEFKSFYIRRFFRLIPATLTYITFLGLLAAAGFIKISLQEVLATLFFWRNYLEIDAHYTAQFWSLSVEEHFYLLFPSFLFFLKTKKKIAWGIILAAISVSLWRKLGTVPGWIEIAPWTRYTMMSTFGRLDGLLLGTLLAFIQRNFKNLTAQMAKIPPVFPLTALLLLLIFPAPFSPTLKALLFPLIIFSTISNEKRILSQFLEWNIMTFIGRISYSLYIWHALFVYKMASGPAWLQSLTGGWISLLPTFLVSYASYRYIETPLRLWGVRLSKKYS